MNNYRPSLVTGPAREPISIGQIKHRVNLAMDDDSHDCYLTDLVKECREEVESDCDMLCCTQTWQLQTEAMVDGLQLYKSPIQSVTSIQYYDTAGTVTTLPTSVYSFDSVNRKIFLKPDQIFPVTQKRFDAWTVIYVAGYTTVPAIVEKAVLLLAENYFLARDPQKESEFRSYNRLIAKMQRSTYP